MIEIESMPYCWIDMKPIDNSDSFKILCGLHGKEEAMRYTFDYCLNKGSAELREALQIVTGGVAPGGMNR